MELLKLSDPIHVAVTLSVSYYSIRFFRCYSIPFLRIASEIRRPASVLPGCILEELYQMWGTRPTETVPLNLKIQRAR